MLRSRLPPALLLVALLSACSGAPAAPPGGRALLPVPLVRQAHTYSCGAAALLGVLYYYRRFDPGETELYGELGTNERDGTHPARIVAAARAHGLRAELREGVTVADLRAALARREPVIVDLQAWTESDPPVHWSELWDDGHYVVAVGLDDTRLTVMDPSTPAAYATVPLAELDDRWHDFEDEDGGRHEYRHMAIFIAGDGAADSYPQPLAEMH